MSIQTQITRIQTDRNTIRNKLIALGLSTPGSETEPAAAITETSTLDDCARAVDGITNNGAVSVQLREGETYTIPAGYHSGTGTVSGVSGGGNYGLQSKAVTPTKAQQNVTPDEGYYGLSDVTVAPIPAAYQDVTSVTAGAADVLANKIFVDAAGRQVAGAMPNNGAVEKMLDTAAPAYTVPEGYHDGKGTVRILPETRTVTPGKSAQTVTPASGKVLSGVTVEAIPDAYQDVTGVTAGAAQVLSGSKFVDARGVLTEGAMPDNGDVSAEFDGLTADSVTIPAGYTGGGTIRLTGDIENLLCKI